MSRYNKYFDARHRTFFIRRIVNSYHFNHASSFLSKVHVIDLMEKVFSNSF